MFYPKEIEKAKAEARLAKLNAYEGSRYMKSAGARRKLERQVRNAKKEEK